MKSTVFIITLFAAVFATGCRNNRHSTTDEHSHNETLQLTAYNAEFELFAEAVPFVAGQSSDILAHFSFLKNFKPLAEGSVTASLIIGADGVRQTLEQPTRTGIYRFTLQPAVTGTGKLIFDIKTAEAASQIVVRGITVFDNEHEAHEAAALSAVTSSNGITFTKEQSWKVDFATAEVRSEPFGQMIRTTAQVLPSQDDELIISAKTGGTAFFKINLSEGTAVSKGQTLLSIDGNATIDNNLSVRYAEAESEYSRAKIEYSHKTELAKDNIVSQDDLLKAKTEYASAEAVYNSLRNNFTAGKQNIISPTSGFVTRVLLQNGQYVEAGQPVLIISQNRSLLIKAELQPKYFDMLNNIISANIRLLGSNRTCTLEELDGRVLSYGKSVDISNPLIPVFFQIKNVGAKHFQVNNTEYFPPLLVGSFVELFIKTQTDVQVLTVLNEAIVEEMGNSFVFVQLTPELFEKRPITTGRTDGIRTEIIVEAENISPLFAGNRIVSKGAVLVKLAQSSAMLDPHAGHVH